MTGRAEIDDDAIRAMLDERAGRIGAPTVDVATIVAAAGPRAVRFVAWRWPPTVWTGLAAAVAVVVLAASGALLPLTGRPASSATSGPVGSLISGPVGSRGSVDPDPSASPEVKATPTGSLEFPVVPPPKGSAWSVAELAGLGFTAPAEYVVRGYLVATPPLRCPDPPAPSDRPDYGCHEIDWLTDEPFQPWLSGELSSSVRSPAVGLRVQNGAYAAFAPDPRFEAGVGNAPRLGVYQVRFSVRSTCDLAASSPGVDCAGGLYFAWEVVGRVSPVTRAYPDSCPPEAVVCW